MAENCVGGRKLCGWGVRGHAAGVAAPHPVAERSAIVGPRARIVIVRIPWIFEFFLADAPEAAPSPEDSLDLREVYVTLARLTYS